MKITFNKGKSVKWKKEDIGLPKPAFGGFNWWLWIPFLRLRFKSYGIYFDTSWLCYWWSFNLLYRTPKYDPSCQALTESTPNPFKETEGLINPD